jgi:hypothetical protein
MSTTVENFRLAPDLLEARPLAESVLPKVFFYHHTGIDNKKGISEQGKVLI